MADRQVNRKLAAILSADVVGYSRLMQDDDAATVATLQDYRATVGRLIERQDGRVVNAPGDNILAEFPSAVVAVQCAAEIQKVLEGRNLELSPERRMAFRIGINLGDVITEDDGTLYGDGVNVAARMEALAEAGGICISSKVLDEVEGKLDFGFEFLGEQPVKNIDKPVRVYRVRGEPGTDKAKVPRGRATWATIMPVAAVLVLAIGGIAGWQLMRTPEPAQVSETDPALKLPDGPTIAVLPFRNLSEEDDQDFFSDGLTEDIITRLTHFRRFFVIARNSTSQYKGQSVDLREVGRALGARYVVEGSVRKAGDSIRVTAQLIDAEDGTHMWAEAYDRDLTAASIFQVQDEITERLAATIAGASGILVRAEIEAIKDKPTDNLDAYECVLRTIKYFGGFTPDAHKKVRDCLERAVELDPNYADAWGLLAIIYVDEDRFGFNPRDASLERALEAAQKSVQLDENGQFSRFSLALTHFFRHELDAFFAEADRAIALNPNHSFILAALGDMIFWAGQLERGHALIEKAAALNPGHPGWYNFVLEAYPYLQGDYETALKFVLKIQMPGFFFDYAHQAAIYAQLGKMEEAHAAKEKLLEVYPNFAEDFYDLVGAFNQPESTYSAYVDGYRKAGIDIPDKPPATH